VAFTKKRIAPVVEKVLRSAIQNAKYLSDEQGLDVDVDNLYVKTAIANEGPRMKRIRPAPMGRAFRYQRRLAHIIVTVAEKKSSAGSGDDGRAELRSGKRRRPRRSLQPRRPRRRRRSQEGSGEEEAAAKKAAKA
jgi:large subunit ribosomal protein L22